MPSARAAFFMATLDKNGLRTPNKKEWSNLPKSVKKAIDKGVNVYQDENGVPRLLRYKTRAKPKIGGKKYEIEGAKDRRANRGNLQKRANQADKSISKEEYIAIGKKNGFSEEDAVKHYEINQAKLKKLQGKTRTLKGNPLQYEHYTPNASKAYGGIEHWRNIGPLGKEANNKKSDLLITKKTAKKSGIPLTKEEAVLMDLRGDKPVARGQVRKNIEADLTSRKPVTARLRNKYVSSRQAPNKLKLKTKNGKNGENGDYTNGRTNGEYTNGKVNGGKTNGKFNTDLLGAASKTRKVDALANIGANAATGNYVGAAVGTGALGMTAALQNTQTQKALGKHIGRLVGKRASQSMLKAIPGLDIFLSGKESLEYLKRGELSQAGIAAMSGAIGWVPIIGDGLAASLDLTNTGIDISKLQKVNRTPKKKRLRSPTRRLKFDI